MTKLAENLTKMFESGLGIVHEFVHGAEEWLIRQQEMSDHERAMDKDRERDDRDRGSEGYYDGRFED